MCSAKQLLALTAAFRHTSTCILKTASLLACCSITQVVRRPDDKRPPLTNIAELTAGLLSHVDLDATDITAALFLASAAQNRRRRLRIAKALLPVYKAIRSGAAGSSGTASEERLSSGEEGEQAAG